MKPYHVTVTLNGTYEFTVEAENKDQAECIAELNPIELWDIKSWDTKTEITEEN